MLTLDHITAAKAASTGVCEDRPLNYKSSARLDAPLLATRSEAISTTQIRRQWRWPRGADEIGSRHTKRRFDHQTPLYPLCRGAARVDIPTLLGTRHFCPQTFGLIDSSSPMLTVAEGFAEIFRPEVERLSARA